MKNFNRHSIRLKGYDYSGLGHYFVTICTQNRECIFGNVANGEMMLNELGRVVQFIWESLPKHHPVELDQFQIMPNHIHMIIIIVGARFSRPTNTRFSAYFKYESTKQINNVMGQYKKIWQRNYYEHIIRDESELDKIRDYIKTNPSMWDRDRNNPEFKN